MSDLEKEASSMKALKIIALTAIATAIVMRSVLRPSKPALKVNLSLGSRDFKAFVDEFDPLISHE